MPAAIISDLGEIQALAGPWRALASRARARPFQEHVWHAAWLATLGAASGHRPHTVVLRQGVRLLGVMPLALRRWRGVRLLEWSGVGATDYNDALLDPEVEPGRALAAMWDAVLARGGFDVARLGQVRADAACHGLLAGLQTRPEHEESAYVLPLAPGTGREWLAARPKPLRQTTNRLTRHLAGAGGGFWTAAEPCGPLLDVLVAQKRAWLAARGLDGFVAGPTGAAFVRDLAAGLADLGALHLSALRAGDRFVACHLGFVRDGALYYYLPSYDPAWAKHSPGIVLLAHLAMWCKDHGIGRLDLLLGDEAYKLRLGAVPEPVRSFLLPRGPLGRVAVAVHRLGRSPAAARLKAALGRRPRDHRETAPPAAA